jgi:hypothetical protein
MLIPRKSVNIGLLFEVCYSFIYYTIIVLVFVFKEKLAVLRGHGLSRLPENHPKRVFPHIFCGFMGFLVQAAIKTRYRRKYR